MTSLAAPANDTAFDACTVIGSYEERQARYEAPAGGIEAFLASIAPEAEPASKGLAFHEEQEAAARRAAQAAENARLAALAASQKPGAKYDAALDVTEIAKRVRAELKAAAANTASPLAGCAFAVRIRRFSGGRSIDVAVTPPAGTLVINLHRARLDAADPYRPHSGEYRFGVRGRAILAAAEAILEAYNFDRSDIMTDHFNVLFYGNVSFAGGIEHEQHEEVRRAVRILRGEDA